MNTSWVVLHVCFILQHIRIDTEPDYAFPTTFPEAKMNWWIQVIYTILIIIINNWYYKVKYQRCSRHPAWHHMYVILLNPHKDYMRKVFSCSVFNGKTEAQGWSGLPEVIQLVSDKGRMQIQVWWSLESSSEPRGDVICGFISFQRILTDVLLEILILVPLIDCLCWSNLDF